MKLDYSAKVNILLTFSQWFYFDELQKADEHYVKVTKKQEQNEPSSYLIGNADKPANSTLLRHEIENSPDNEAFRFKIYWLQNDWVTERPIGESSESPYGGDSDYTR